jgi:Ca2+-binding EF-hand superfamily protein
MLQRDPNKRLSVEQVLNHPWLTDSTVLSNAPLGSEYVLRIQGLELRKKLKIGFQAGNIEQNHKSLKENFQEELPYLFDAALEDRDKNELDMEANAILTSADFKKNLTTLKRTVMEKIKAATSQDDLSEEVRNQVYLTAPTLERQRSSVYGDDIDYEKFKQLVTTCKLECLANEKIFSIFDASGNGVVNMKQFLFALIALKPFDSTLGGGPDGDGAEFEQAAELYFQFFDMNEDGFIGMSKLFASMICYYKSSPDNLSLRLQLCFLLNSELPEFKMAFNCLFQDCDGFDESICMSAEEDKIDSVKAFDAVSVFNQIDTDSNGRIDISEFKVQMDAVCEYNKCFCFFNLCCVAVCYVMLSQKFYSEVFMATVSRKSIIAACNSFVGGVAGIDTSAAGQNSCESITGKKRDHTVVMGK